MINRTVLVGHLTKDPILRKTASGTCVTSFTVACNRKFKQEGQPDADFINCVAWNKVADNVNQYTHKGSLVGVEGRIQTRSYDDQQGKRVYVTEIVAENVQFLDNKNASNNENHDNTVQNDTYQNDFASSDTLHIESDDLPF